MSTMSDTSELELAPTKDVYTAIKADVDENAAVKELIDNVLDNARRQGRGTVTVKVRHQIDEDGDPSFIVEDDSGGLPRDELSMLFALGESEKDDITGSIGAFGIGAKKALMCLGKTFTIRSQHADADIGYEYTVDEDWLADDDTWTVPVKEVALEEPRRTEIEITDLNFNWQDIRDDLASDLRTTYERYIRGQPPVTLRLLFPNVEGTDLEPLIPPTKPDYSYTPWDELYPRRYTGIVLDPDETSTPIRMRLEVGLLAMGDEDEAGVDWLCQHRVVERGNQDAVSGFGNELPKFKLSTHKRLKARIELLTDGDAKKLPWNSDKSRISERHPVTDAVRDVLSRVLDRYMRAGYGTVEPAFFEPFTHDDRYAANGGEPAVVNLNDTFRRLHQGDIEQLQITDKPTQGLPEISDMQATVEAHAHLGITYEYLDWAEPWMRPTYHALLTQKREKFGCFDELEPLESPPPDFTQDGRDGEVERDRLAALAQDHVNQGVRYTDLAEWEQPRYTLELERAAENRDLAVEALTPVDTLPDTSDPDDEGVGELQLSFGPFTETELEVIADHLGPLGEYSPEKRTEVLVDHFRRLNMAGVRFDAEVHGD